MDKGRNNGKKEEERKEKGKKKEMKEKEKKDRREEKRRKMEKKCERKKQRGRMGFRFMSYRSPLLPSTSQHRYLRACFLSPAHFSLPITQQRASVASGSHKIFIVLLPALLCLSLPLRCQKWWNYQQ